MFVETNGSRAGSTAPCPILTLCCGVTNALTHCGDDDNSSTITKRWRSKNNQRQLPIVESYRCLLRLLCSPKVHQNSPWKHKRTMVCVLIYIYTRAARVFTSGHLERGGKTEKKSRHSSFAGVTWRFVGCIVCWTCVVAFVERLTENTQCGAGPCLPEIDSVLGENPERPRVSKLTRVPLQPPPRCYSSIQPTDLNLLGIGSSAATIRERERERDWEREKERERETTGSLTLPANLQWNRTLFPRAPSTNTVSLPSSLPFSSCVG